MASTWKEKDPAQDADPELLKKARENPKGIFVSLYRQVHIVKINVVCVLPSIQDLCKLQKKCANISRTCTVHTFKLHLYSLYILTT